MKFGHDPHAKNYRHAKKICTRKKLYTRKKLCARKKLCTREKLCTHKKICVHKIICDTFWQFLAIIGNFIGLFKKWGINVSGTVFQSITFPGYNNFGIKFQPLRIVNNFSL